MVKVGVRIKSLKNELVYHEDYRIKGGSTL